MTTEIKAAIAGAIEALEYAISHIHIGQSTFFPDRLAALRRIEFVDASEFKRSLVDVGNEVYDLGANNLCDHLTTTGHAIVKMGE